MKLNSEQWQILRECTTGEDGLKKVLSIFYAEGKGPVGQGKLIMIVDDDTAILSLVQQVLEQNGFQAVTTSGARACLSLLPFKKPDLLLLDMTMPEMDGSELFAKIRSYPQTAQTPVIFMTGLVSPEEEAEYNHQVGEQKHYLGKPFNAAKLVSMIATILKLA